MQVVHQYTSRLERLLSPLPSTLASDEVTVLSNSHTSRTIRFSSFSVPLFSGSAGSASTVVQDLVPSEWRLDFMAFGAPEREARCNGVGENEKIADLTRFFPQLASCHGNGRHQSVGERGWLDLDDYGLQIRTQMVSYRLLQRSDFR